MLLFNLSLNKPHIKEHISLQATLEKKNVKKVLSSNGHRHRYNHNHDPVVIIII